MKAFLLRHPVAMYFSLVLFISYGSFLIVVGPRLLHGGTEQASDAEYILFPIINLGVLLTALVLIGILEGGKGLRDIFSLLGRWHANVLWYAVALLVPPALILVVLTIFRTFISPVFTPKFFAFGIVFGIPALLEEIGWTGYAYPRMHAKQSALVAAIVLGVLWGLWHAPVVDYLGAAAPHGAYCCLSFSLSSPSSQPCGS